MEEVCVKYRILHHVLCILSSLKINKMFVPNESEVESAFFVFSNLLDDNPLPHCTYHQPPHYHCHLMITLSSSSSVCLRIVSTSTVAGAIN